VFIDNFHYYILGTNSEQRIVFVHGLMAFAANWRKIANKLEGQYQCLIYDQRGHGRSMKPESGYRPTDFAEDLYKITNELGWDQFHLVGHSMGGRVAIVFANMHPEKVKTLCIEDMGADVQPESYQYYEKMLNIVPTPFQSKDQMKEFFGNEFLKLFTPHEPPSVLMTFLQANIEEKPNGLYDWKFSKQAVIDIVREGHKRDYWLEVSSFKMPVLLVRGENSHVLKAEEFEKMQSVNPMITGVEIKGAGHWVHYEKYEEFTACLEQFISSHTT
jgi:pimeloyl-ACP methyl ester carboxylesterase